MAGKRKEMQWLGWFTLTVLILLAGTAAAAAAPAGLEPGAPVKLVRSADSLADCQVGKYGQNEEFVLLDKGGVSTRIHLKQLRRIASLDQKWEITPSFSSSKGPFPVYEFEKTDGSTFKAAVYSWPSFAFQCPDGKFNNWGLSNFKLIEVPKASASSAPGGIRIQLRNGQTITVPVKKEEIISIQFE